MSGEPTVAAGDRSRISTWRRSLALLVAAVNLSVCSIAAPSAKAEPEARQTAATVRAELKVFTDWLARFGVTGYIGEVGWPGDTADRARHWNEVGDAWYREADVANLWVSYWSAGEWWPPTYALAVYVSQGGGSAISRAKPQSPVIEAHATTASYSRGVNNSGAEFGAPGWQPERSTFSNVHPGTYDDDWHYDTSESFVYLVNRGVTHIRLQFRWERIQPALGGPLEPNELARLKDAVRRAHGAGLKVILDVHNYAAYWLFDPNTGQGVRRSIGSSELPASEFYDLWRRLSGEFKGDPGVLAYGLMNEPVGMPGDTTNAQARLWENVSQEALNAIRAGGDETLVMVPGYQWSDAHRWDQTHPYPWINDPAQSFRYEAHHYFGENHSGNYPE